jgi:hypothetical protein
MRSITPRIMFQEKERIVNTPLLPGDEETGVATVRARPWLLLPVDTERSAFFFFAKQKCTAQPSIRSRWSVLIISVLSIVFLGGLAIKVLDDRLPPRPPLRTFGRTLGCLGITLEQARFSDIACVGRPSEPRRKNVVMMVSDGFGPASETFGRTMYQILADKPEAMAPLDALLVGASRTRSNSSLVTDSAAGMSEGGDWLHSPRKVDRINMDLITSWRHVHWETIPGPMDLFI